MPTLRTCDLVHGNAFYSAINPLAGAFESATLVPKQQFALLDHDPDWGIYDKAGSNISLAAYRRGPYQDRVGQSQRLNGSLSVRPAAEECTYMYIGPLSMHHGHYLLTSVARLWPLIKLNDTNIKLVFHGDHDIQTYCKHLPVAAATLRAFNLSPDNFFRPVEPTRFGKLYIPAPSFEETNSAHRIHGDVGTIIGRSLPRSSAARTYSHPVIFSKARLTSGVSRILNEDKIIEHLVRKGMEVIYPETLSLGDQIDIFERAPAIVSYAGSALHTSLLAERSSKIIGLNLNSTMASSQILIDFLKGNDSSYFYPNGTVMPSEDPAFAQDFHIDDPVAVADEILRQIDAKLGLRARLRRMVGRPAPEDRLAYPGVQSLWP